MNKNRISLGKIVKTHGIKGAVKVSVADVREDRFSKGQLLYTEEGETLTVENFSNNGLISILKFEEYNSIETAENLKNKYIFIDEEDLKERSDGSYYIKDLIGLKVVDTDNVELGIIKDVLNYATNDIFVVDHKNREVLVPAIKDIIKSIDIKCGLVTMEPMEGLFDEN